MTDTDQGSNCSNHAVLYEECEVEIHVSNFKNQTLKLSIQIYEIKMSHVIFFCYIFFSLFTNSSFSLRSVSAHYRVTQEGFGVQNSMDKQLSVDQLIEHLE